MTTSHPGEKGPEGTSEFNDVWIPNGGVQEGTRVLSEEERAKLSFAITPEYKEVPHQPDPDEFKLNQRIQADNEARGRQIRGSGGTRPATFVEKLDEKRG